MGIVEAALRRSIRVGEMVDVTLIGGRELRGRIIAFAEDGILIQEQDFERPISFAGIATCMPTHIVQPELFEKEEKTAVVEEKAEKLRKEKQPEHAMPEIVTQEEGWIERYESAAGVGSIVCGEKHAVFGIADVLDQQLADQLDGWFGRAIAVQCTLHVKGALCKATSITGRSTQERYLKAEKQEKSAEQPAERHGFGEILHFDKQNGFGKAKEGDVKFIFRREDIVSDVLWQEIVQSVNTCGIKIAFTAVRDGKNVKYTRLRELAALQTPENVEKPDFTAVIPIEPDEDVNPQARTTFTDGTTMEEEEHAGYIMFYNADKYFGRLQQENGERFYFRANDVMQKSLMDFLNERPDVADTPVTFSIKQLPTGKTAAGRVKWNAPRSMRTPRVAMPVHSAPEAAEKEPHPQKKEEPQAKKAESAPLNRYCENLMRLWNVERETLADKLREAADKCDQREVRCDLLLESVALSDVLREKRDDAMLRYLRQYVREGGGEQLSGFLSSASYAGAEMFDALTQLFAVSDGACGRMCGIIVSDSGMVTLRGEILTRFGLVPETVQSLKEMWKPLVEEERARVAYAQLLPTSEALEAVGAGGRQAQWTAVLDAVAAMERGEEIDAAQAVQLVREEKEAIAQNPSRVAVEWMLPLVEKLEEKLDAQSVTACVLGAVTAGGVRFAAVEVAGNAQKVRVQLGETAMELGEVNGHVCVAIPSEEEIAQLILDWDGGTTGQQAAIEPMKLPGLDVDVALKTLEEQGAVVLRGGRRAQLDELAAALAQDADCVLIPVQGGADEEQILRAVLVALEEGLKAKYGAEVAGLMAFPFREKAEQMNAEALKEALMGALGDFGDVRLLHDQLKGAYIVLLIDAGALGGKMARLAKKMIENGVRTAIAADAEAQNIEEKFVVTVCADSVADKLRAAGVEADEILVFAE